MCDEDGDHSVMMRTMLGGKIHRATVTRADLDYEGSIGIDGALLDAAGIVEFEQVHVLDVTNGARLETYTIRSTPGSGEICINGAAAHLVAPGDVVIIVSYRGVLEEDLPHYRSQVVLVDDENRIRQGLPGVTSGVASPQAGRAD